MKKNLAYLVCLFGALITPALYTQAENRVPSSAVITPSLDYLPKPPSINSADFARDKEIYRQTRAEKGGKRWQQAAFDADLRLNGHVGIWFKESFGIRIAEKETPELYKLMQIYTKAVIDVNLAAKQHYLRKRPFMYFSAEGQTCVPAHETFLRQDGSYPSGHSTMGWGMSLILAEITPERQAAIMARGYEIGQSRVICGVHWQSDVEAGRMVGAALVAQLHSQPAFGRQLDKARMEITRIRARNTP